MPRITRRLELRLRFRRAQSSNLDICHAPYSAPHGVQHPQMRQPRHSAAHPPRGSKVSFMTPAVPASAGNGNPPARRLAARPAPLPYRGRSSRSAPT